MIDHNHFICHFIFGGHLLNIPESLSCKPLFFTCHRFSDYPILPVR